MIKDYNKYDLIKEIPTEDKPILVNNYPYGFRLRTTIAYWIETKGNKQRFCSKTLNPKTNLWNKPKYSTYEDLIILAKEKETGYIRHLYLNITYSDKEEFEELLRFLEDFRTEHISKILKFASAIYETRKYVKVEIQEIKFRNKHTGEIKDFLTSEDNFSDYEEVKQDGEEEEKQKEISRQLNKIFVNNALKEGLSIDELKTL